MWQGTKLKTLSFKTISRKQIDHSFLFNINKITKITLYVYLKKIGISILLGIWCHLFFQQDSLPNGDILFADKE